MKEVKKMSKKGPFVVFEGIDGSGTTTQADRVSEYLNSRGIPTHLTSEPTNSLIGGLIRSSLKKHWSISPEGLQLLFAADRAHHLETEILPILEKGKVVITDRYYFSSIAYGSVGVSDKEWLFDINKLFIKPDLVIYIRISTEKAMQRIEKGRHGEMELFEQKEKLASVIAQYERLVQEFDYFVVVDGEHPRGKVTENILNALKDKLNLG